MDQKKQWDFQNFDAVWRRVTAASRPAPGFGPGPGQRPEHRPGADPARDAAEAVRYAAETARAGLSLLRRLSAQRLPPDLRRRLQRLERREREAMDTLRAAFLLLAGRPLPPGRAAAPMGPPAALLRRQAEREREAARRLVLAAERPGELSETLRRCARSSQELAGELQSLSAALSPRPPQRSSMPREKELGSSRSSG